MMHLSTVVVNMMFVLSYSALPFSFYLPVCASQVVQVVKNTPANARDVGWISWRRQQQPTPVVLLGKFHGQRSLVGYSL